MLKNRDIICISTADWDNPYWTNQHHIMSKLARENRVLFVESLGLRQPCFQKKDIFRMAKRLKDWFKGARRVDKSLFVYSPAIIPFHRFRLIQMFNRKLLLSSLKRLIKRLKFKDTILWAYAPNAADFIGKLRESLVIYHCVDELSANPLIPKEAVLRMEERLLGKADFVFVSSRNLYEKCKRLNQKTHYLPNSADFDHFHQAVSRDYSIPQDLANLRRPIIGFYGALSNYKIDFDLIAYLAQAKKDWSFVLIGQVGEGDPLTDTSGLNQANIHLLGSKAYQILPQYLKYFDVCLLPNRINDYTKSMFPLKFFEYLSCGKPVVATDLVSLREFKNYFYSSFSYEEFLENLEKALSEDPQKKEERIELAKQFTWEKKIDEIEKIFQGVINAG